MNYKSIKAPKTKPKARPSKEKKLSKSDKPRDMKKGFPC